MHWKVSIYLIKLKQNHSFDLRCMEMPAAMDMRYIGFSSSTSKPLVNDASVANFVVKTTNRTVIVIKPTNLLGKAI